MDTALAIGSVNQLCELLQSTDVKKLFVGNEIKLEEFESLVRDIKPILLLGSQWRHFSNSMDVLLEIVKDLVYNAEDWLNYLLFSPLVSPDLNTTRIRLKFFKDTLSDVLSDFKTITRGILGDDDGHKFKLMRREEMCCDVEEVGIIGREADKETLMGILLSNMEGNVSFVAIVGLGGIGKTALSQLVYNDSRIQREFDLLFWVHVSDDWNIDNILGQCLGSYDGEYELTRNELVKQLRDKILGKTFLLVLDDVWCEATQEWETLRSYLNGGGRGSRILVTTRSWMVANALGGVKLDIGAIGLCDAWNLFQKLAFLPSQECDDDLFRIVEQVIKRCEGVPLAIRVLATMFYGTQDKVTWLFLANSISCAFDEGSEWNEGIMSLLWFSYDQLTPELKACIGFCSLFPKGYVIQKEGLISMWLALGYLIPTNTAQTMEQLGEEYCLLLLRGCFFHNIQRDDHGEILSFQMHDLIHYLAQLVAGNECLIFTDANSFSPTEKIRHLYISEFSFLNRRDFIEISKTLRTILNFRGFASFLHDLPTLISECTYLRLLDLSNMALKTFPDFFGKAPLLRYLDLSNNEDLEMLPWSITGLRNLQVLRLCGCKNLIALPEGFSILSNVRYLNIDGCYKLKLRVHALAMSVVGGAKYKPLNKLISWDSVLKLRGGFLKEFGLLSRSSIAQGFLELKVGQDESCRIAIKGCQGMQLLSRELMMANTVPGLGSLTLSHIHGLQHLTLLSQLSHLKNLHLRKMWNVECIDGNPTVALMRRVSKPLVFFPSLEKLVLEWMPNLKGWWKGFTLTELEGGGHGLVDGNGYIVDEVILPSFPCLRDLRIHCCLAMTYFPPCPHVESLELRGVNEALTFCMKGSDLKSLEKLTVCYDARAFNSIVRKFVLPDTVDVNLKYFHEEQSLQMAKKAFQGCATSLRYLSLDCFYNMKSLREGGIEHLTNLQSLSINGCFRLDFDGMGVDMEEEGMPWKPIPSLILRNNPQLVNLPKCSIQSLCIISCNNFEVLGECIYPLTSLHIEDCKNFNLEPMVLDMEEEVMLWESFESLSSLTLSHIPKLVNLPQGFQYLTSLESLSIISCKNLEVIGECVCSLTSLRSFHIEDCKNLKTLPERLTSLVSLQSLYINNCPKLELSTPLTERFSVLTD